MRAASPSQSKPPIGQPADHLPARLRVAALAKLTSPRMHGMVARERLFGLLDERRRCPVVWVTGPPGAGKTTLLATYLEARNLPGIWYQVDEGDADPGAFFYYLREAATRLFPRRKISLPLFTPEYLSDSSGFTRRFFREFCGLLPDHAVVVFDNGHAASMPAETRRLLPIACEEIPQGINFIIISRADPPAEFSRLSSTHVQSILDADALRLSLEETGQLAACEGETDERVIGSLHAITAGWPVGVTLMLAHRRRTGGTALPEHATSQQALFDYFAGEIYANLRPGRGEVLLRTAFLPRMTVPMAKEMSGDREVGKLLEYLCRHHYFTERRGAMEPTYQYHALFREFLLARASESIGESKRRELARRAAALCEANDQVEDALQLYRDAGDWDSVTRIILDQAADLLAHGRGQTLRDWISGLPEEHITATPWLAYWLGASLVQTAPVEARPRLEQASEAFGLQPDNVGQALAVAAIMQTYYFEGTDFFPLAGQIALLQRLLASEITFPSAEIELRVYTGMLMATLYCQPNHPMLPVCIDKVFDLVQLNLDANLRVTAGFFLLSHCIFAGNVSQALRAIATIDPLLAQSQVTPLSKVLWLGRVGFHYLLAGDYGNATAYLSRGERLATDNGLTSALPLLSYFQGYMASHLRDAVGLERLANCFSSFMNPARRLDQVYWHAMQAGLAMLHGDRPSALREARMTVDVVDQTGFMFPRIGFRATLAQTLVDCGRSDEALPVVREARDILAATPYVILDWWLKLIEADLALGRGEKAQCRALLCQAFGAARKTVYYMAPFATGNMMSRLCAEALEAGIEVDYVRHAIRGYHFLPKSVDIEHWPWPIKIYTLGRFSIAIEDVPLRSIGKAQKKPLDLVKSLVALGGREVSSTRLIEHLWPESEGDAGEAALTSALHRLRKLLGRDDAILVSDSRLTLNPHVVWVDVWAFERLLGDLEDVLKSPSESGDEALARLAERSFRLYQGHFLDREGEQLWMLAMRDKLRSKFLRHLLALGRHWEAADAWDRAAEIYQQGIEHDNLAEELYRRLMVTYQKRDQPAGAIEVYRRCRQMLSVVLGVKPSAETEALYQSVQGR